MLLCCGEALIDMLPAKCGTTLEEGFIPKPGGSVYNTAIALGRLGAKPRLFTGLSDDMFGKMLTQGLQESHVDSDLCNRTSRPTTMAYVKLTKGHAKYLFHDENTATRMIGKEDLPKIPDDVTSLFLGGVSLMAEPVADSLAYLAERESKNSVIMVDPNIRPQFITDETRYRARLERIMRIADVVKVSDEDLDWLVPGPLTLGEKAECILDSGHLTLLVTRGSKGISCFQPDGNRIDKAIDPSPVVDTVGAGDTFNAGFLFNLQINGLLNKAAIDEISEKDLLTAIGFGARAAAMVVSRAGANPPWASELQELT